MLDAVHGAGAAGVRIELAQLAGDARRLLKSAVTGANGRAELLGSDEMAVGEYEMLFRVGDYFRGRGMILPEPAFLDEIPVLFAIADPGQHYHVPIIASPWAYSTYRGGPPVKA
jgi:5-hydroxyisourate hydrolase